MPDPDFPLLYRRLLARDQALHFAYDVTARRVVHVSEAYERVMGGAAARVNEELPGWLTRLHPDDRPLLQQQLQQALAGELVQDVEVRVPQADGRTQWLRVTACGEQLPHGSFYLSGRVEDVTLAKENSVNAEKFTTKKNAILEILSHDLAAPLVQLQQLTTTLRAEVGETSPMLLHLLDLMERTSSEGVRLIRDFVDTEFLESANVDLKRERTDLVPWLATLLEEYQRMAPHTRVPVDFVAPPQPVYALVDVNKFQQVLNNLVSNALKFTPDGGRISVRVTAANQRAIVTVADTGVGIPAALQPHLFERFTKARRPGLRGEKSTGLGMSVIKTLVGLHQGTIAFTSTEGAGSTFTIELPVALA